MLLRFLFCSGTFFVYISYLYDFRADLKNYILDLGFTIPLVEIRGKYEIGGSVLLFPIRSKGDFWAVFGK